MVDQHEALEIGPRLEGQGRLLCQLETGHDIRNTGDAGAINRLDDPRRIGLIGQRQQRHGVGVVDELFGDEGVQKRLHRRIGRGRIQEILPLSVDHVLIGKLLQRAQTQKRSDAHSRMAGRFDGGQIPAAAFDPQHLHRLAEQVLLGGLDRGVAAAVQHQGRIGAE